MLLPKPSSLAQFMKAALLMKGIPERSQSMGVFPKHKGVPSSARFEFGAKRAGNVESKESSKFSRL
jgi:hypothetical protein